jgi:VWFA-related protein
VSDPHEPGQQSAFTNLYLSSLPACILLRVLPIPRVLRLLQLSAALLLCGNGPLFAQQTPDATSPKGNEPPAATVSVNVKAVTVLATVRDKHGKIVPNLTKDDFTLEEDGHPVSIRYFSRESDLPLTLGLLVDTSMSQRAVLDQERAASGSFLEQVMHEKDTAFLIHFDHEVELLQDLTSSRSKLEDALSSLRTAAPRDEDQSSGSGGRGTGGGDPRDSGHQRGQHRAGTLLYDAIYLASDELMKKQPGRKALIVLSDGVDRGSKESLESAVEAAQRADTLVYCVLFKGEEGYGGNRGGFGYPGGGGGMGGPMGGGRGRHGGEGQRYPQQERPDGKKIMERIAKETGGRFFEASKKQPIDQIYASIQEELRNQYSLGFTPDKADPAGYHKLLLKTKQNDSVIQTREGFYLESASATQ